MRVRRRLAGAVVLGLILAPVPAEAFELSGGVSVGGIQTGTVPRLAMSPNAGLSWRMESGFLFALNNLFSILPPINTNGFGIYNQTSASIGYASKNNSISAGPSLSSYSMPACGATLCGRVAGIAPGGHLQASIYFSGPIGLSMSATVDWVGGVACSTAAWRQCSLLGPCFDGIQEGINEQSTVDRRSCFPVFRRVQLHRRGLLASRSKRGRSGRGKRRSHP